MLLRVVGPAANDKAQAAVVNAESANPIPHITISCASGVNARYSNDLVAQGWTPIEPFVLESNIEVDSVDAQTPTTHRER